MLPQSMPAILTATVIALWSPLSLSAQTTDKQSKPGQSNPGQETEPSPRDSTAADSKPKSQLDKELLQRLLGDQSGEADPDQDPLQRAIEGMRSAQQSIEQQDTSRKTRDLQKQVIKDLETLIKLARQRPPNSDPSQSQPRSPSQQRKKQKSKTEKSHAQKDKKDQSPDSEDRNDSEKDNQAKFARRRLRPGDIWGHLPSKLREKLQQHYNENYLPQYDDLVRRYFQALAEQGRGGLR